MFVMCVCLCLSACLPTCLPACLSAFLRKTHDGPCFNMQPSSLRTHGGVFRDGLISICISLRQSIGVPQTLATHRMLGSGVRLCAVDQRAIRLPEARGCTFAVHPRRSQW